MPNPDAQAMDGTNSMEPVTPAVPNSTPAPASTEPAGGKAPSAEPKKPMGTTPGGGHRNTPEPATPDPTTPTTPAEGGDGTEGEKAPEATPKQGQGDDPKEPVVENIDYETKFSESSKEAQRLLQVIKDAGIDPSTGKPIVESNDNQPAPTRTEPEGMPREPEPQTQAPLTDEQLAQAIPGFHNLTEVEKTMLRDTKATVNRLSKMQDLVTEMYDEKAHKKQFAELVAKDQFKALSEHAEEFNELAYKNENLKVPLETLAGNFLYQKGLATKPAEKPAKPAPSGVEPSSGGGKEGAGKTEAGFTSEEMATIRKTDPKRYAKLAREGKIKIRS